MIEDQFKEFRGTLPPNRLDENQFLLSENDRLKKELETVTRQQKVDQQVALYMADLVTDLFDKLLHRLK